MNLPAMTLESSLPVSLRAASSRWRIGDESWTQVVAKAQDWIVHPEMIPQAAVFKQGSRRLVFRLDAAHSQHPSIVVKAFPLDTFRNRWRQAKYGRAEAANILVARQRKLPVPRVFAYGWARQWGLVSWNALIMELMDGRSLKEHLIQAADSAKRELLWRVLPLFQLVYQTGCNHIDLGPHAILLGESSSQDCIIDFQYCRFLDQPAPATFAAQAGYFGWCLTTHWNLVPRELAVEWFHALLDKLALPNRPELEKLFQHHLSHKASIRERLGN